MQGSLKVDQFWQENHLLSSSMLLYRWCRCNHLQKCHSKRQSVTQHNYTETHSNHKETQMIQNEMIFRDDCNETTNGNKKRQKQKQNFASFGVCFWVLLFGK